MFASLASILVVLSLIFGGAGAAVSAAQNSLPGQRLYDLKTLSEQTRLELAGDDVSQITLHLEFANRRVEEMRRLVQEGITPPAALRLRLQQQIDEALRQAEGLDEPLAIQTFQRIQETLKDQDRILAQIHTQAGSPAETELIQARERVREQLRLVEERLYQRRNGPGSGQGNPPAYPSRTPATNSPSSNLDQTYGTGNGYGPGPAATETPIPGSGYGPGPGPDATCTPQDHDWQSPGPHNPNPTTSDDAEPEEPQRPGDCDGCGHNPDPGPDQSPGSGGNPETGAHDSSGSQETGQSDENGGNEDKQEDHGGHNGSSGSGSGGNGQP